MPKRPKLTRRAFLETSGLAAGAVAALPTLRPTVAKDATVATKSTTAMARASGASGG